MRQFNPQPHPSVSYDINIPDRLDKMKIVDGGEPWLAKCGRSNQIHGQRGWTTWFTDWPIFGVSNYLITFMVNITIEFPLKRPFLSSLPRFSAMLLSHGTSSLPYSCRHLPSTSFCGGEDDINHSSTLLPSPSWSLRQASTTRALSPHFSTPSRLD